MEEPSFVEQSEVDVKAFAVQCDEEKLPFQPHSFDLVLSSMYLHWVNDLPGTLKAIKSILRPDGAFIGCMLGGSTLQELRHCFYLAQQERTGGVSSHCSPFALPSDIAGLMQSAGFSLLTIDVDTVTVLLFPLPLFLMKHCIVIIYLCILDWVSRCILADGTPW
jgi:NADH dehydrogenase [ubiquinone] 1 alpha subcomplex assembly factor 5